MRCDNGRSTMNRQKLKVISNLLLLLTALIWGIAFVAQSVGMDHVGPWTFVFFRNIISAVVLMPVVVFVQKHKAGPDYAAGVNPGSAGSAAFTASDGTRVSSDRPAAPSWKQLLRAHLPGGILCGVFLAGASIAQQVGIQYTTAGKAGFITAMYVVLVPLISIFLGKRPGKQIWFSVLLGIVGLYLISVKEGFQIGTGDILVMLCALLFSGQILCIDHYSPKVENVVLLSDIQFFTTAVITFAGMMIFERPSMENVLAVAMPILYAGLLSGAAGYTLQMIAQKHTDPTVASLLMSLESVFSALAGWAILGEILTLKELSGCALVLAAVILAQIPLGRRKNSEKVNK